LGTQDRYDVLDLLIVYESGNADAPIGAARGRFQDFELVVHLQRTMPDSARHFTNSNERRALQNRDLRGRGRQGQFQSLRIQNSVCEVECLRLDVALRDHDAREVGQREHPPTIENDHEVLIDQPPDASRLERDFQ